MAKLQAPVTKAHLEAIGRITVNFALLESTVSLLAWQLLGVEQLIGQAVTAESSFRNRVALVGSLFRLRSNNETLPPQLDELLKRVLACEEKRNIVTHSLWGAGSSPGSIARIKTTAKFDKGLKHQFQQMTAHNLEDIAEEIATASGAVQAFILASLTGAEENFPSPVQDSDDRDSTVPIPSDA